MVRQVPRPEAVQGDQDEGRPGETAWGRREEGKELGFFSQLIYGEGLEKLFITFKHEVY